MFPVFARRSLGVGVLLLTALLFASSPAAAWDLQTRITAPDPNDIVAGNARISADGSTMIVASWSLRFPGAAYIYHRDGGAWTLQATLTPSDADPGSLRVFGYSVAINQDGSTAVIGELGGDADTGAAYIFVRSGNRWSEQVKLPHGVASNFGDAVAISYAGDTVVIGDPWLTTNKDPGIVYVYTRMGDRWSEQARLNTSDATPRDYFGGAVAISGDGSTIIIGAPGRHLASNTQPAAAFVFVRSGIGWQEQAQLATPETTATGFFGRSVAVNRGGDQALIGLPGMVLVFARSGAAWAVHSQLQRSDAGESFGDSVALSGDGSIAAVGTSYGSNDGNDAAYVFTLQGMRQSQGDRLTGGVGARSFGAQVSLSGDGSEVLVGGIVQPDAAMRPSSPGTAASQHAVPPSERGAIFVFVRSTPAPAPLPRASTAATIATPTPLPTPRRPGS